MGNSRPATLHDVARESGFSKSVVSRALLNQPGVRAETAAIIKEAAQRLRYHPNPSAQALVGARTATIGLVLRNPATAYYAELARHISADADNVRYRVISVSHGAEDNTRFDTVFRHLLQLQVDGLIVSSSVVVPSRISEISEQVPTVVVGRGRLDADTVMSVSLAPTAATSLVDAAAAAGHRHIGLLHLERAFSPTQFERNDLTESYASSLGLQVTRAIGAPPVDVALLDSIVDAGPSVIFCAADSLALTLLARLSERGIAVPDDVGVVGFDGLGVYAHPYIGLSTYRLPIRALAHESVGLLLKLMEDPATPAEQVELLGRIVPGRTARLVAPHQQGDE